ncbi:MAG: hypothetical protein RR641_03275 [Erysipelotrichaceae bacterium]
MIKGQTLVIQGYEVPLFPMQYCNITQGDMVGTHSGTYAIDNAGRNQGIDAIYAPVTMKHVARDTTTIGGNAAFFQSISKVLFADGTIDYITFMFIHDNYINDYHVGQVFKQGQEFGDEGSAGLATGNHSHIEVAKGKWRGYPLYNKNAYGTYYLPNNIPIEHACVMDQTIILAGIADWKYAADIKLTTNIDQILKMGEHFIFPDVYLNEDTSIVDQIWCTKNSIIGGYLPTKYITRCNFNGITTGNQMMNKKNDYFKIEGKYTVAGWNGTHILVKEWNLYVNPQPLFEVL